jgi:hypothetical protein
VLCVLFVLGCQRSDSLQSCSDDISGQWQLGNEPGLWLLTDSPTRIDGYPLLPDKQALAGDVVAAPRVVEFERGNGMLVGRMRRRFMHREQKCEAAVALRVTACREHTLVVEREPLNAPTSLSPCSWPLSAGPRGEQWRRVGK